MRKNTYQDINKYGEREREETRKCRKKPEKHQDKPALAAAYTSGVFVYPGRNKSRSDSLPRAK